MVYTGTLSKVHFHFLAKPDVVGDHFVGIKPNLALVDDFLCRSEGL